MATTGSLLAGTPVHFTAAATTHDPLLTVTGYAWSFGDGAAATGPRPSHTYGRAGRYTLTLTVTDSGGERVSRSATISIAPSCHVPNVVGSSLGAARSALAAARCALGRVKRPGVKRPSRRLVVGAQSLAAGTFLRAGTPVNLTLVYR